jgi:hypothetical protein
LRPSLRGKLLPHDRQELPHTILRVRCIDEIEVASLERTKIGHLTLVDAVRIGDDPALSRLAKDHRPLPGQCAAPMGGTCDQAASVAHLQAVQGQAVWGQFWDVIGLYLDPPVRSAPQRIGVARKRDDARTIGDKR